MVVAESHMFTGRQWSWTGGPPALRLLYLLFEARGGPARRVRNPRERLPLDCRVPPDL